MAHRIIHPSTPFWSANLDGVISRIHIPDLIKLDGNPMHYTPLRISREDDRESAYVYRSVFTALSLAIVDFPRLTTIADMADYAAILIHERACAITKEIEGDPLSEVDLNAYSVSNPCLTSAVEHLPGDHVLKIVTNHSDSVPLFERAFSFTVTYFDLLRADDRAIPYAY